MKKLLSVFLLFFCFSANAQNNNESNDHMSFKGVPIDGTLNDYVFKMKQSGFSLARTENGVALLEGDFAGYKDCVIGVSTIEQKDLVSRITVLFPDCNSWSTLSSNYFNLKELLTEKYGGPSEVVEKFDTSYKPSDDNNRMHHVGMDRCKYYSTYETGKGSIQLTIEKDDFVRLTYFDKINSEIIREKAKGDL